MQVTLDTDDFGNDMQAIGEVLVDLGQSLRRNATPPANALIDGEYMKALLRNHETREPVAFFAISDEPVDKTQWVIHNPVGQSSFGTGGSDMRAFEGGSDVKH